jgi:hypothetical protein
MPITPADAAASPDRPQPARHDLGELGRWRAGGC